MKKNNEKYDLVITPHRQSTGYIKTKRQTIKRKVLIKRKQITRKRFLKQRNAFSESETSHLQELCRIKESINKNYPVIDTLCFLTQKPHHTHQYKEKEEEKKHIQKQTSTTIQMESTNKTHLKIQIDSHKAQK